MKRTSFSQFHCSLAQTLEKMGDWWTPLILRDLFLGVNRFDDLVEDLGLSRNLLASRLKDLIANGIITHEKPSVGRAHYLLTPAGFELVPILVALTAWGDKWAKTDDGAPIVFSHKTCGKPFTPVIACSNCDEPISHADIDVSAGPGGKLAPGTQLIARRLRKHI